MSSILHRQFGVEPISTAHQTVFVESRDASKTGAVTNDGTSVKSRGNSLLLSRVTVLPVGEN